MPDKIKILELEIVNYRQYYDKQVMRFLDRDEGFSVILGENGSGKSNILNAINWCFYKKEPHNKKNKGKYIVNQEYMKELESGKTGTMSVKVKLQIDDTEFHISRVLTFTRNEFEYEQRSEGEALIVDVIDGYYLPKGTVVQHSQTGFTIEEKTKGQSGVRPIEGKANTKMNSILPEKLSPYFLLDGEYLEKFWEDITRIKIGVEQISQLHLLDTASIHLSDFKTSIPKIGSSVIDSLTTEINTHEYWLDSCDENGDLKWSRERRFDYDPAIHPFENYHLSGKKRRDELIEDVSRMKTKLGEIAEKFANSDSQLLQTYGEEEEKLVKELGEEEPNLLKSQKQLIETQIQNGPILLLQKTFKNLDEKVNRLRDKGDLPYEEKVRFAKERLEMNTCICGCKLNSKLDKSGTETNEFRKNVEDFRDEIAKDIGLDYALIMRDHFNNLILNNPTKFIQENFEEVDENYLKIKKAIKKIKNNLSEVRIKIQNVEGGDEVEKLKKDHNFLLSTRDEAQNMIKDINDEIKKRTDLISQKRIEQNKEMRKDKRARKLAFEQNAWLRITQIVDTALVEIKNDIRNEVQEKTFQIFTETMYKKKVWDRFVIDENYSPELFDSQKIESLSSLSAGESLFLALSFVSALKQITGYRFPLVIDTPLGKVSGKPRFLLSQSLSKYLPDEQLLFLATDTEFISPLTDWLKQDPNEEGFPQIAFGQLLEKTIHLQYHAINHSTENETAAIQNYIPDWRKKNG